MTHRERLVATLTGTAVDRVPVNFYEIGGFKVDPSNPDPFNIYNAPSWSHLLTLAEERTDLIRMRAPASRPSNPSLHEACLEEDTYIEGRSRYVRTTVRAGGRTLTQLVRRDPEVDTRWTIEHLLKDVDDLRAYLELPDAFFDEEFDFGEIEEADRSIGERGLVMLDTADPLCLAASLFAMDTFVTLAYTEQDLFDALLRKLAAPLLKRTHTVAAACPGHLWRIYGPEYATEPYLPPDRFEAYVVRYTEPLVRAIQAHGGWARLHCHGRIRHVLPYIADMGVDAIDPIEPEPQGDVTLEYVRREYGRDLALFGNLEVSDIETLPPREFEKVVARALEEGTRGEGRGFCLMPSAAPYGRDLSPTTLANYETMVRLVGA